MSQSVSSPSQYLTLHEYLDRTDRAEARCELVSGILVEMPVTGRRATCRIPDLLVHSEDSKAALAGAKRATLTRDMPPPAIAIEIVSPGQTNRDRDYRYKYVEYAARGIAEYWIVDPEMQQVTVCRWVNGLYENVIYTGSEPIRSSIVSSFTLSTNDILEAAAPNP